MAGSCRAAHQRDDGERQRKLGDEGDEGWEGMGQRDGENDVDRDERKDESLDEVDEPAGPRAVRAETYASDQEDGRRPTAQDELTGRSREDETPDHRFDR